MEIPDISVSHESVRSLGQLLNEIRTSFHGRGRGQVVRRSFLRPVMAPGQNAKR
jgi:hypothetical protein